MTKSLHEHALEGFAALVGLTGKLLFREPEQLYMRRVHGGNRLVLALQADRSPARYEVLRSIFQKACIATPDSPFFWVKEGRHTPYENRCLHATCAWRDWKRARRFTVALREKMVEEEREGLRLYIQSEPATQMACVRISPGHSGLQDILALAGAMPEVLDAWHDNDEGTVCLFLGEVGFFRARAFMQSPALQSLARPMDISFHEKLFIPMESLFKEHDLQERLSDIASPQVSAKSPYHGSSRKI